MIAPAHDISDAMDRMIDHELDRHAWLSRAAAQIRQWKAEDKANGIEWETTREAGSSANNAPASNQ